MQNWISSWINEPFKNIAMLIYLLFWQPIAIIYYQTLCVCISGNFWENANWLNINFNLFSSCTRIGIYLMSSPSDIRQFTVLHIIVKSSFYTAYALDLFSKMVRTPKLVLTLNRKDGFCAYFNCLDF